MSNVNAAAPDEAEVLRLIQASKAAGAAGRPNDSDQLLARAAQLAPAHPAVLNELGLRMMQRGEAAKARELFLRATQLDPNHPSLWSNLAASLDALGLPDDEREAIERALSIDPRHLPSLLQKAALIESRGDARNAARAYRNALATLPPGASPPPTVAAALDHARAAVRADDAALAGALEAQLSGLRNRLDGGPYRRVDRCIELLTGRRARHESRPTFMYVPEIPSVEFFDRGDFTWLDALESAAETIRSELTTVMVADRSGLEPYIVVPDGIPAERWHELDKSRRWSAYFLWNHGVELPAHLAHCPRTAEALRAVPQCDVPAGEQSAFFSILDAKTRIPAHTGITNARLTVHLPLIVPPGCGFRVGGDTREWVPGKAWVFDDTIEHEAWNDSDAPRAILVFYVWNPFLSPAERELIRAATEVVGSYYRGNTGGAA